MGCASSAPPPQQNGAVKHQNPDSYPRQGQQQHHPQHHPQQQQQHPQHHLQQQHHHPQQQPVHQPPPYQQAPPQQPPPPRQQPPPPPQQPPPQAPAPQPPKQEEDEAPPAPVELNQGVVDTLIDLETRISSYERRNVIKQYELKANQVKMLQQQVQNMVAKQQQLDAQTQKEYQDIVDLGKNASVQQMMNGYTERMSKEQEEYVQAMNRSEIHKKELDAATRQLESLKGSIQPVQKESEELQQLYDQQDSLLASIFNGKYGSDKEYKLESNLDLMMEKKQRISVAKYKWTQSRQLISHAVNQMGFGVRRWNDAIQVPPQNSQLRYNCAAEARNNFVAAFQNIASAQSYLSTIKFPYCTPQEMQTLNLAITHIFTDLLTVDRHRHAMECYVVVYKRSAALVQWFDFVINKTILKDHEKSVQECASLQKELKAERMSLIKEKVREKLGDEAADKIEIKEGASTSSSQDKKEEAPGEDDKEPEVAALSVIDADTVSQAGELAEMKTEGTDLANAPAPLSLEELAPAPNMDDIFGNIEQLKKQHEEQQKEYEKQQGVAKARADQGLQDKLAQRRSRRRRMNANQAETQALGGGGGSNQYYALM